MLNMKVITAALTAATLTVSPGLVAPVMAQQAPVASDLSESELDAFVVAFKDILVIEEQYQTRLQNAADEAERQDLIGEAQVEMTQAVDAVPDIDVDRYSEILQLAQADPDLQAQLIAKLEE